METLYRWNNGQNLRLMPRFEPGNPLIQGRDASQLTTEKPRECFFIWHVTFARSFIPKTTV